MRVGFFGKGRYPETGQEQEAGGHPEGDFHVLFPLRDPPQKDGPDRITRVSPVTVCAESPASPGRRGYVADCGYEIGVQKSHPCPHDDGGNAPGESIVSRCDPGDSSAETPQSSHDRDLPSDPVGKKPCPGLKNTPHHGINPGHPSDFEEGKSPVPEEYRKKPPYQCIRDLVGDSGLRQGAKSGMSKRDQKKDLSETGMIGDTPGKAGTGPGECSAFVFMLGECPWQGFPDVNGNHKVDHLGGK